MPYWYQGENGEIISDTYESSRLKKVSELASHYWPDAMAKPTLFDGILIKKLLSSRETVTSQDKELVLQCEKKSYKKC